MIYKDKGTFEIECQVILEAHEGDFVIVIGGAMIDNSLNIIFNYRAKDVPSMDFCKLIKKCINDELKNLSSKKILNDRKTTKENIIKIIQNKIESKYEGVITHVTGFGCPDCGGDDGSVWINAYMASENIYREIKNYAWELQKKYGKPNNLTFYISSVSPIITKEYCKKEYEEELKKRRIKN